jgi:UDP-glucoronosyl and UDP-glucosyl transferase
MDGQPALIQRVCDAIADAGLDATLTLGPAADGARLRTPETLDVVTWGDHDALLPRCAAVITHGGLGTTLRALAHGVPLLVLPLGRDQAFNAARVAELGAGLRLDAGADAGAIRHALGRLLEEPGFANVAAGTAARIAGERTRRLRRRGARAVRRSGPVNYREGATQDSTTPPPPTGARRRGRPAPRAPGCRGPGSGRASAPGRAPRSPRRRGTPTGIPP